MTLRILGLMLERSETEAWCSRRWKPLYMNTVSGARDTKVVIAAGRTAEEVAKLLQTDSNT